jgi:EPS-associated MarR family transcriptional regulator
MKEYTKDKKFTELDLLILHEIEKNSITDQRSIASKLKISLGKVNYCIKALIEVGYIKLDNFSNSKRKVKYLYILTPKGVFAKTRLTKKFLLIKLEEYNKLKNLLR